MIERLNAALEGRYRIQSQLGEGGMATVYLAEDLKHRRNVALKVLRPELAAVVGAERFLAEIETTANLQHPHILPLFDSGEADGFLFYVMPHVEGESLRERLDREHQLPVEEALGIVAKVAAALQYAHEQGVIHRDVKPANILLHRGEPLVADFGIALALSEAGGGRITETGLSLGTPHYMSPEQAAGERTLDKRSDVYALGCVLYEMLTGEPPFGGPTAQAVLGRILVGDTTPPTELRAAIPIHVEHAILKTLEKLPADRFDTAADFARALRDPAFRRGVEAGAAVGAAEAEVRSWKWAAAAAVTVALILAVLQASNLVRGDGPEVRRHRLFLGSGIHQLPQIVGRRAALAPDGSGILYADTVQAGGIQLGYFWKPRDRADAIPIPGMNGSRSPEFSPDGRWIAHVSDGELRKQPLLGGTSVLLADSVNAAGAQALAWLADGQLLFENAGPILERIDEDGSGRDTVATVDLVGFPIHASGLLGGGGALVSSCTDPTCGEYRLYLVDLERDTVRALADDVLRAWHVLDDRVVYVDRRGGVFAARLDEEALRLEPPLPLFDGVATAPWSAEMELGADGSLLYLRGAGQTVEQQILWVDREGTVTPVDEDWSGSFGSLALSPEGSRLAITDARGGTTSVWVKELPDGPLTRITPAGTSGRRPAWTPDGLHVVYQTGSGDEQVFEVRRADASTGARRFIDLPNTHRVSFSPDGRYAVYRMGDSPNGDLRYLEVVGEDTTHHDLLVREGTNEVTPALSPDARWLAYMSDVSGIPEVYVRPFPDVETARHKISDGGAIEPVWSRDGRELFYRDSEGRQVAVQVDATDSFRIASREPLFSLVPRFSASPTERLYDVAADGRFVMVGLEARTPGGSEETRSDLILVENWFEELRDALSR